MAPLTSYTGKLTDEQASALETALSSRGFKFRAVPYARFAGEKDKINVVFYESGKLVVQGKGTQEFVEFVLEPEVLKQARLGYEAVLNPDLLLPRIGVDESGKGDFFGPLCIAGAYINETSSRRGRMSASAIPKIFPATRRSASWRNPQNARLRGEHRDRLATKPTTGFTRK